MPQLKRSTFCISSRLVTRENYVLTIVRALESSWNPFLFILLLVFPARLQRILLFLLSQPILIYPCSFLEFLFNFSSL